MTGETETAGWLSRLKSATGPRGGLAVIVAAHGAFNLGLANPWIDQLWENWYFAWVAMIPVGIWGAQLGLIAALAIFGDGHWFCRWPRSMLLVVWLTVAHVAGSWLLAQNRDGPVFKNFLIFNLMLFSLFLSTLGLIRIVLQRRFQLVQRPNAERFQFRLMELLLLIGELAVLMALIRAIVPYNRRWLTEVFENLPQLSQFIDWGLWCVSILAIVPAIILTAWQGRQLRFFSILAAYELALILVVSVMNAAGIPWYPSVSESPSTAVMLWESISAGCGLCISGVATVWLTLSCVRWLGYDFLPLPRRGGGRQSSEATSAA